MNRFEVLQAAEQLAASAREMERVAAETVAVFEAHIQQQAEGFDSLLEVTDKTIAVVESICGDRPAFD